MNDLTCTGRYARLGATDMKKTKRPPNRKEKIDVIVRDDETGSFSTFDIPKNADVVFDLGEDKHLRGHKVHVRISALPDGTLGLSIRSTQGGLRIQADSGSSVYATTLRESLMPVDEQPDDFNDPRDDLTPCGSDD